MIEQLKTKLIIEFLWLYILLPISLYFEYPIMIKLLLVLMSFIFICMQLFKKGVFKITKLNLKSKRQFFNIFVKRFILVITILSCYTYYVYPDQFFNVMLHNTKLWIGITLVYCFISVPLQEIVYRTYFFYKFEQLFANKQLLLVSNAVVFSIAHIILKSPLVLILTCIGGYFFAITYHYFRSTRLVWIEHSLYGFWLFTVGLGEMFAFPGAEVQF